MENENRLKADWLVDMNNTLADLLIEALSGDKMKKIIQKYLEKGITPEVISDWSTDPSTWTNVFLKVYEKIRNIEKTFYEVN